MTARRAIGRSAALLAAAAFAAVVALIVAAIIDPKAAAAGWLVGFAFWSEVLVGSIALAMIHRLTAGRWGEIIAPVLAPTAAAVPILIVLAVPVFIAVPLLYPWAGETSAAKPDVLSLYLNAPLFILRTVIALVGWLTLAFLLPRIAGRGGLLLAALGLVFNAVITSSIAIDWFLSLEVPFTSSSFGASVAIIQLIAALAWAAFLGLEAGGAVGDVGGLLLAFVLGITYVDFMAVLVIWYGDLPHEEAWFDLRQQLPWPLFAWGSFILVSVAPILSLLLAKIRNSRAALRIVAASVLVGVVLYDVYLIAPPFGVPAIIPSMLGVIAIGLGLVAWMAAATESLFGGRRSAHVR